MKESGKSPSGCLIFLICLLVLLVLACKVSAENFCCNPVTYVCEDCGVCPNVDCSTCELESTYNMADSKGNIIGTVHIIKADGITFMYQCFIVGNHSKCTGYFLKED